MKKLLLLCLLWPVLAWGNQADIHAFKSPEDQRRAVALARELRCPQCQNQNLVESNSPMAESLRLEVYRMVDSGLSNEEIIQHMTERFGDFVRYDPPLNARTLLLWFFPVLLLLPAGWILWRASGGREKTPTAATDFPETARDDTNQAILQAERKTLGWYGDMPEIQAELAQELALAHHPVPQMPLPAGKAGNKAAWLLIAIVLIGSLLWYVMSGRWQTAWRETTRPDPLASLTDEALIGAAQQQLEARIRSNPRDQEAWAELAQFYLYQEEYDQALRIYERLGELEGLNAAMLAARATVLYYQAGERLTPAARRLLDEALAKDPDEVTALSLIANDHFYNRRYAEAEQVWQKLLDDGRQRVDRERIVQLIHLARQLRDAE